jgi:RND family efflux transporter MFP subunit
MITKTMFKLSCAGIALLTIVACSDEDVTSQVTQAPLKPVRTMTVSLGSISHKSFTGVVDAIRTAELGFRVSGELTSVNSKEGDFVKKGQVLATLDQTDFKISLDASQAEFDRASAEFKRAQSLISEGAISTADFENLKAQKSNATAQLKISKQNLKYTVLKTPFEGIVAKQYLSNFEKISSSMSFSVIQDLSAFEVKINIPESVMIKLKRDESDREVYAVFDGNQKKRYPLTFKEVSTRSDEKTQTYAVRFVMDAPKDINLLPGMSARVFADLNTKSEAAKEVYVPAHTVLEDSQGRFVYVVNETESAQGDVERRAVVVGELNENGILVLQGLDVGDKVVTAGMSKMSPGLTVRLMAEG